MKMTGSVVSACLIGGLLSMATMGCSTTRSLTAHIESELRQDGTTMVWLSATPRVTTKSYPALLYLDGSGCASVVRAVPYLYALADEGFAIAAPEKRGVSTGASGGPCSREFLETNDRAQRIADAELTIKQLSSRFPNWDGRLVVLGASEGATIAPEIAALHPDKTVAVILMGGDGEWDLATELRMLVKKYGGDLESLEQQLAEIEQNPVATRTWRGEDNTFKRWASYLKYRPFDYLVRIDAPIYHVRGSRDMWTPVESLEAMIAEFRRLGKTNLTFRSWPGLDHRWHDPAGRNHIREVGEEIISWLRKQVR